MITENTRLVDLTVGDLLLLMQKANLVKSTITESTEDEFMDVDECAFLTKYKPTYIRQLVHSKEIPHYKKRGSIRFIKIEIIEWLKEKKVETLDDTTNEYLESNQLQNRIKIFPKH